MDAFLIAFETVLPLFLVIFTGLLFSMTGAANMHWIDILNKYALWIGFPALVVVSLMQLQSDLSTYLPLILINSGYIILSILLAFPIAFVFRLSLKIKQSLFLILPFGNVAYLGIPVLENTYGAEVLPVAAIIAAVYVFWMLTLGLFLVEVHNEKTMHAGILIKSLLKNPLLLSVFAGLAIVYFKIPVPGFAEQTLRFFSQSVTAVVLFSLGIFLGLQKAGKLGDWVNVALFATLTMVVLPSVLYFALRYFSLPSGEMKATILEAAMPLGLTPYALSVQYELESKLFARVVVFGTLLSLLVLPLWIYILN
jgi:predicted permease